MLRAAFTLLAVVSAGAAFSAFGGDPGGAVATVDGEPIAQQEFDHWLTVAAKSQGDARAVAPEPGTRGYRQLRDQVMQLLISFRWIQGEATALNIAVTDAEVTKSFEDQKRLSFPKESDFQKFLKTSGQTQDDIVRRVRLDELSNKIRDRVVAGAEPVTEQAIADFYAAHQKRFAVPEKRDLRIVLTKHKAEADRALAALTAGRSWKAVAKRYSIDDLSKSAGGRLPGQYEGTLDRKLDKAVFGARKHKLVGPVKTQYGYYVFIVTRVTAAHRRTLAQSRKTIKETLEAEAQQKLLDLWVVDFTARWRAKTECAAGFRTTDCRNGPAPTPTPTPDWTEYKRMR